MPAATSVEEDERRPLLSPVSSSSETPALSSSGAIVTRSDDHGADGEGSSTSSFSCRQCCSTYVPIEPLLLGYAFTRIVVVVLTGFYFFDQASHMYGDPSMNSLNPCGKNGSGAAGGPPDRERAENVQKEALQMTMIGNFTAYMTAVLPTLFLGPLIDRLGRRLGFVLPILGSVARAIVFLFVLGTGASPYFVYIGTTLEGLGGGFGAFLMTTFSAAADVTTPGRQRALRICIVEAVNVLGSALALFIAGQWRRESYTQPVMFAAAIGVCSLIFALWGMPETHPSSAPKKTNPPRIVYPEPDGRVPWSSTKTWTPSHGGRPGEERRAGQVGEEGEGRGLCAGATEHVGINDDAPVLHNQVGPHPAGRELSVGEGQAGNVPHQNHNYFSFSPTGHRLSHQARLLSGAQRSGESSHPPQGASPFRSSTIDSVIPEASPEPFQPPVYPDDPAPSASCCSLALGNIRRSWGVYFRSDDTSHPARRCVLLLCFICFLLTVAVNFSKPSIESVIRLGQLCWTAVQESEFDSGWLVQHWLFILVTLHVLQSRLKVRNVTVAMVGCVSALCAPLIFSLATLPTISEKLANVLVFVSAGSGTLARALIPMLRAMSSAVVSLDEQGALFASYACVELAGAAVFDLAASQVYKATVHVWEGIIFVIMTFFFVVVFFLLIVLSVVQRRAGTADCNVGSDSLQRQNEEDAG